MLYCIIYRKKVVYNNKCGFVVKYIVMITKKPPISIKGIGGFDFLSRE
jgi:hypothetical protein